MFRRLFFLRLLSPFLLLFFFTGTNAQEKKVVTTCVTVNGKYVINFVDFSRTDICTVQPIKIDLVDDAMPIPSTHEQIYSCSKLRAKPPLLWDILVDTTLDPRLQMQPGFTPQVRNVDLLWNNKPLHLVCTGTGRLKR